MRSLILLATSALSIVPSASQQPPERIVLEGPRPSATGRFRIPAGARVAPSGYLTIEDAPASPAPPPSAPAPARNERTFYAQLAGISNEEAAKRLREQEAFRPTFERLLARIREDEPGNFTDVELVHRPDWAYLVYFKRDPERTLAKYTRSPRVKARASRYTRAEIETLAKPWIDRFAKERLFTGYGMNPRTGRADIDMVVSEEELARIATREGWGPLPDYLNLRFDAAPIGPAVDPVVAEGIRIFPQSDRNLGIIHMAGLGGKVFLREGCFMVSKLGTAKTFLAYFPREVGLYLDLQGYLALRTRTAEPRRLGRIGETFSWAGPIGITEEAPMVRELRARCGNAPLIHLSVAESQSLFLSRYPHLRNPAPPPPPPPKQKLS